MIAVSPFFLFWIMKSALLLFLLFISGSILGQTLSTDSIRWGLMDYQLDWTIQSIQSMEEDPDKWDLEALHSFLLFMKKQDDTAYDVFMKTCKDLSKTNSRKSDGNDYKKALLDFRIHLYRAVGAAQMEEYAQAAKDLYATHQAFLVMKSIHPAHPSTEMAEGFFCVVAGQVPDKYQSLVKIAGIRPQHSDGFAVLERTYRRNQSGEDPARLEAGLLWVLCLWEFSDDTEELWNAWKVLRENGRLESLLLVKYLGVMAAFKTGHAGEVTNLLENLNLDQLNRLPHFYLQRGKSRLYRRERACVSDFDRFIQMQGSGNFVKSAWLRKGFYYSLVEEQENALTCFQMVLSSGNDQNWADRQAVREVQENPEPDPLLLNLRLLYDGGYYQEGEALIRQNLLVAGGREPAFQMELYYRLGRCLEGLHRTDEAIAAYERVVKEYEVLPSYMVPASGIAAAKLCIASGKQEKALRFLDLSEKANKYGYQKTYERQIQSLKRQLSK